MKHIESKKGLASAMKSKKETSKKHPDEKQDMKMIKQKIKKSCMK